MMPPLVPAIHNHGDLAARLADLRQLEREGVRTTQTQTEVIAAYEQQITWPAQRAAA